MPKTSVLLKDLQFFAFHGLYEEEKILGNDFFFLIFFFPQKKNQARYFEKKSLIKFS